MSDHQPTPEELRDMQDRINAMHMRHAAAMLSLSAAMVEATVSMRSFFRAAQQVASAAFDELQRHPDMLELEVSTASWYPDTP
ncbi:hypothetical protein ACWEOE_10815 [Amycolatopsis sp. NPDC004368]